MNLKYYTDDKVYRNITLMLNCKLNYVRLMVIHVLNAPNVNDFDFVVYSYILNLWFVYVRI